MCSSCSHFLLIRAINRQYCCSVSCKSGWRHAKRCRKKMVQNKTKRWTHVFWSHIRPRPDRGSIFFTLLKRWNGSGVKGWGCRGAVLARDGWMVPPNTNWIRTNQIQPGFSYCDCSDSSIPLRLSDLCSVPMRMHRFGEHLRRRNGFYEESLAEGLMASIWIVSARPYPHVMIIYPVGSSSGAQLRRLKCRDIQKWCVEHSLILWWSFFNRSWKIIDPCIMGDLYLMRYHSVPLISQPFLDMFD